jgi:uncharacterized protein YndB with AHSA1/START domain
VTQARVTRVIAAPAAWLFDAWTRPELLRQWWGPAGVRCVGAEVDLRVGGAYRIGNAMPDGSVVWIAGEFTAVEPPHKIVYTWRIDGEPESRVTVTFVALAERSTEVVVEHDRVHSREAAEGHARGWIGCLDGLARFA